MKIVDFRFTLFVWTFLVIFSFSNTDTQEILQENSVCIELKNAALSVANDEVLVLGEVRAPTIVKIGKLPFTISRSIAVVGRLKRTAAIKNIQVFKCPSKSEIIEDIIVTNLENIKKGIEPDLKLKGGEIILVQDNNSKKTPSILEAFEPRYCGIGINKDKLMFYLL